MTPCKRSVEICGIDIISIPPRKQEYRQGRLYQRLLTKSVVCTLKYRTEDFLDRASAARSVLKTPLKQRPKRKPVYHKAN